jgi:hypothetical protein
MATQRIRLTPITRAHAVEMVRTAPEGWFFLPPIEPTRTLDQNAKMWAMLNDIARQVLWPVNGRQEHLDAEAWKDIFTASLSQEQRLAAGLRGGAVLIGAHTSGMGRRQVAELIELMYSFGAEHNVAWSEPAHEVPGWYREGVPA